MENISFKELKKRVLDVPIAHESVTAIPIEECGESLVDLLEHQTSRLKPLPSFSRKYDISYEGYDKVRKGVYEALLVMLEGLPETIGIAFGGCLRPIERQKLYFETKFLSLLNQIPDVDDAYTETCKYLSPFIDNVPVHATGAAIDMTLFDVETSKVLDLGIYATTSQENDAHMTLGEAATKEQKNLRLIMLSAAVKAGLANYGYEWWHYSYGDKMHAKLYDLPFAKYGLVADTDNPILKLTKEEYLRSFR